MTATVRSAMAAATAAMGGTTGGAQKLGGTISTAVGTMAGFMGANAVMGVVSSAFSAASNGIIGMNAELEKSELQFATLMGDSAKAKEHVAFLFEFAKKTPFETGPIMKASRMLQTFGGDALNTKDMLQLVGDASAATSAPIDNLSFWFGRLYAQVKGGQPFGEAAMRMQELAVMTPEVRSQMEALQKKGADAETVFKVFTDGLGKHKGAMEKMSGTWGGVTSTLTDTVQILTAKAFKPLFDLVRDGIGAFNNLIGQDWISDGIGKIAGTFAKGVNVAMKGAVDIAKALAEAWRQLKGAGDGWLPAIREALVILGHKVWGEARSGFLVMAEHFRNIGERASGLWEAIRPGLEIIGGTVWQVFSDLLETIGSLFSSIAPIVVRLADVLWAAIEPLASSVWDTAVSVFGFIGDALSMVFSVVRLVVNALIWLGDATGLTTAVFWLLEKVLVVISGVGQIVMAIVGKIAEGFGWAAQKVKQFADWLNSFIGNATTELPPVKSAFEGLNNGGIKPLEVGLLTLPPAAKGAAKAIGDMKKPTKEQEDAAKALAKAHADLVATLMGTGAHVEAEKMMKAVTDAQKKGIPIAKMSADMQEKIATTLTASIDRYARIGKEAPKAEIAMRNAAVNALNAWRDLPLIFGLTHRQLVAISELKPPSTAHLSINGIIGDLPQDAKKQMAGVMGVIQTFGQKVQLGPKVSLATTIFGGKNAFAGELTSTVMGALQGGGNPLQAVGGLVGKKLGDHVGKLAGKAIGGALGATAGSVIPVVGTMIGALAGKAIGGLMGKLFGGDTAKKEAKAMRDEYIKQAGGLDNLKKAAQKAGVSLDALMNAKKPEQVQAAITALGKATEKYQGRLEALGKSVDLVNARAEIFSKQFMTQVEAAAAAIAKKLPEGAKIGKESFAGIVSSFQKDFDHLGLITATAFAGLRKEGKTLSESLAALEPSLAILSGAMSEFGFAGNAAITKLIGMRDVVKANEDVFNALDINTRMISEFGKAGILTKDVLQSITNDIAGQLNHLAERGVNMSDAMGLMQPTLQKVWEGMRDFGIEVDDATAKLIAQAVEGGIVGDKHRDAQDRIAIGIEKVATIMERLAKHMGVFFPDAVESGAQRARKALEDNFQTAATNAQKAMSNIRVPPVRVGIVYESGGHSVTADGVPVTPPMEGFAKGGIATRASIFGEGGEAEIAGPIDFMTKALAGAINRTGGPGGGGGTVIIELDSQRLASIVVPEIPGVLERYGIGGR